MPSLTALAINKAKTRTMSGMLQFRGGVAQFVSFGAITVGAVKPSAPPCGAKPGRAGHCHDWPFSQCAFMPSFCDNGRTAVRQSYIIHPARELNDSTGSWKV